MMNVSVKGIIMKAVAFFAVVWLVFFGWGIFHGDNARASIHAGTHGMMNPVGCGEYVISKPINNYLQDNIFHPLENDINHPEQALQSNGNNQTASMKLPNPEKASNNPNN